MFSTTSETEGKVGPVKLIYAPSNVLLTDSSVVVHSVDCLEIKVLNCLPLREHLRTHETFIVD